MSKKVINSIVEESGHKSLSKLTDAVIFEPTPTQLRLKAKFWERFGSGPFAAGHSESISGDLVAQVTNSRKLTDWWSKPGFRDWFLDTQEETFQVKALFGMALGELQKLILNPETQDGAKVQALKLIMEINDKMPNKNKEKFLDEHVGKMDKAQLDASTTDAAIEFLTRKGIKVVQESVIDVKSEESRSEDKDKTDQ